MSNLTFTADLSAAAAYMEAATDLRGERPAMLREFLAAKTDDDRAMVVEVHGGGHLRRAMRQVALCCEGKAHNDPAMADVFWALRDDIDAEDDTVFCVVDAA